MMQRKTSVNNSYGHYRSGEDRQANRVVPGDAVSAYPPDLAGVILVPPMERLRAELAQARAMYQSAMTGDTVDYARLAGAMAGALDNMAFMMEWYMSSGG